MDFPEHLWLANNEGIPDESLIFHIIRVPLFHFDKKPGLRLSALECHGPNCALSTPVQPFPRKTDWLVLPEYFWMEGFGQAQSEETRTMNGGKWSRVVNGNFSYFPVGFGIGMTGIVSKAKRQYIPASQQLLNPPSPSLAVRSWSGADTFLSAISWTETPWNGPGNKLQNKPEVPGLHQTCCRCVSQPCTVCPTHPTLPRKWHRISTSTHRSGNSGGVEIHPT